MMEPERDPAQVPGNLSFVEEELDVSPPNHANIQDTDPTDRCTENETSHQDQSLIGANMRPVDHAYSELDRGQVAEEGNPHKIATHANRQAHKEHLPMPGIEEDSMEFHSIPRHSLGKPRHAPTPGDRGDYVPAPVNMAAYPMVAPNHMGSHYQVSTPIFNGKGRWTTFIRQFEAIALTAHWNQEEKLHYLLVSLKEEAAEYAFDLEDEILGDYDALVHELSLRFRITHTRESSQQTFYNRKIKPNETLREYAADLKRLILRAFPRGISPDVREDMTLKQFFDGLHDEDARFHVKSLQHPRNVDEAVGLVQQYYNYCTKKGQTARSRPSGQLPRVEEQPRNRGSGRYNPVTRLNCTTAADDITGQADSIRTVKELIGGNIKKQSKPATELEQLTQKQEALTSTLEDLSKQFKMFLGLQNQSRRPFNNQKPHEWLCFSCGTKGHFARECPMRFSGYEKKEPSGQTGNSGGSAP
jgi:hypothetical protein